MTTPAPLPTIHIMVDLETLGITTDALVTEIAAAVFTMEESDILFRYHKTLRLEPEDTVELNVDTYNFWNKTPENAAKFSSLFNPTSLEKIRRLPKIELWHDFHKWLTKIVEYFPKNDIKIWGNGIGFDIAKINYNFERLGLTNPIMFYNEMDMRTLVFYTEKITNKSYNAIKAMFENKNPHNALADVKYQIEIVKFCNNAIVN